MVAERQDPIRLVLPARTEFLQLARVSVATVATIAGFDLDGIDDLRLAVDELCAAVMAGSHGEATLELKFEIVDGGLDVTGWMEVEQQPDTVKTQLSPVAELLLSAAVDDYSIGRDGPRRVFRLRKRHQPG